MKHHSVTFINEGSIPRCYAIGDRAVLEERISEIVTEPKRVAHTIPRRPKKNVLRFINLLTGGVRQIVR